MLGRSKRSFVTRFITWYWLNSACCVKTCSYKPSMYFSRTFCTWRLPASLKRWSKHQKQKKQKEIWSDKTYYAKKEKK